MRYFILAFILAGCILSNAQSTLNIQPQNIYGSINQEYKPGYFFVPKNQIGYDSYVPTVGHQKIVRSNIIESVLNNATDENQAVTLLLSVSPQLQALSNQHDEVLFIFEKMPLWLSSSSNGSPAQTPGWYVFNTKAPASWQNWEHMVDTITQTITQTMGITNASFEIWNEPDIGSWSDTKNNFFQLYKRTFTHIKGISPTTKVGGLAMNHFANNIGVYPPYGFHSSTVYNQSLLKEWLDSCSFWALQPDFISFHHFGLSTHEIREAEFYLNQQSLFLFGEVIPIMLSEWNTVSDTRDTPLQKSIAFETNVYLGTSSISNNCVAAWQDFDPGSSEFHQDYGMITTNGIKKPVYQSLRLFEQLHGNRIGFSTNAPSVQVLASANVDTCMIYLSNVVPPAFFMALNQTLFTNVPTSGFTIYDLDTAGFISIATSDVSNLLAVYNGSVSISPGTPLNDAIINAIPIYNHYESIQTAAIPLEITLENGWDNLSITSISISDSTNNNQFTFDSLLQAGWTPSSACTALVQQELVENIIPVANTDSSFILSLKPNEVRFIKVVKNTLGISENNTVDNLIYPNPGNYSFILPQANNDPVEIKDGLGNNVFSGKCIGNQLELEKELPNGMYYVFIGQHVYKLMIEH